MPEFAIYSGYQMDRQTFRTFASGLPGADDLFYLPKKRRNFLNYVFVFNTWKNRLPPKQQRYVPKFRCMLICTLNTINGLIYLPVRYRDSSGDEKEYITHVFFPFRFVEYKADSQLTEGHPDNIPISEETPADQAKLDSLIRFLKERGGTLERDMVTFTYMKELHPSVDWRNVRSLASFIQYSD